MQIQAKQAQTLDQAAHQDVKSSQTAQPQPIELNLQQLQAVSGGTGENTSPVKGW